MAGIFKTLRASTLAFVFVALSCIAPAALAQYVAPVPVCKASPRTCDQGQAVTDAFRMGAEGGPSFCKLFGATVNYVNSSLQVADSTSYRATYNCSNGNTSGNTPQSHFIATATCANRAPLSDGWFAAGGGNQVCKDGCMYGTSSGPTVTGVGLFPGTAEEIAFRREQGGSLPTGAICAVPQPQSPALDQETCRTVGTLTQCMRPDGKHCAQASTGKKFCWNPTEAGTKQQDNDAATKAPAAVPNVPPTNKPPNNGDWQQTGSGSTTITHNGNTTNYNTNTYQSNYGSQGSGGGSTNPDGSENPGTGGGDGNGEDGHGTVGGDGQCQGTFTCSGGDPVLCAIAQQQYQARCEADGRFDGEGTFPGDGDGGAGQDPEKEDVVRDATLGLGMLDEAGLGVGGSCPDFGTLNVMGRTIEIDPDGRFCQIIGVARACLLILGAFIALGILAGRNDS